MVETIVEDRLLVSSTRFQGGKFFAHAREQIKDLFGNRKVITFIPYANPGGMGHQAYRDALAPTFQEMGYELRLIENTEFGRKEDPLAKAEGIFVGGGNTWQLSSELKNRLLEGPIQHAVWRGVPYLGSPAGSNVAGITIGNTNDMPAVRTTLNGMSLVPFNINPHYQDSVTLSPEQKAAVLEIAPQLKILLDHQGETREQRIREYHALGNFEYVVALREGSMVRMRGHREVSLKGTTGAVVFRPGKDPVRFDGEAKLDEIIFENI